MLSKFNNYKGFSLIELLIVLIVIGIALAIGMQYMGATIDDNRRVRTEREMDMLTNAITGNAELTGNGTRSDFGYFGDIGAFPPNLNALYQNPGSYSTWDGPYLPPGFAQDISGFRFDEWGQAYAYTGSITITSNGSGTAITKKIADATSDYLLNSFIGIIKDADDSLPGVIYRDSVNIVATVPNGSGGTISKIYNPDSVGVFKLDSLPAGTNPLDIIYTPANDTLNRFLTILPRHKSDTVIFKFASAWFTGGSSSGTVVYEEFSEAKRTSNGNSLTIPTPAGTSAGDLLIAAVVTDGNKSSSIAPPGGEGWTEISINQRNGQVTLGVWWKLADASESPSHQFSWGGGGQEAYGWIMRFTGHDSINPIDNWAIRGGNSSSPQCRSVTTTVDNALIVRIGGFDDDDINVDNTGLAGHTDITMDESSSGNGTCSGGAGFITQATAGASGTANFSLTNSEQWRTMTIAIAPE